MKAKLVGWTGRLIGACLIVVVLWLVGWQDTVEDTGGQEHVGSVVGVTSTPTLVTAQFEDGRSVVVTDERSIRRGLRTTFLELGRQPRYAVLGVLVHLLGLIVIGVRWGVLLHGAGLPLPVLSVLRLSWIGHFLGTVVPGGVASGDVLKSLYVARELDSTRTRALVTSFTDRVLGLLVLGAIAATAVIFSPNMTELHAARTVLFVMMGAGAVGAVLFYSALLRRVLRVHHLTRRLPFPGVVDEIREALRLYRGRPGHVALTVVLALIGHSLILACFWLYGLALGAPMNATAVLIAIPVAQVLAALPGLPGGWGGGEFAFFIFLPAAGVPAGAAVALSITYRLAQTLLGLPGGLMLTRRESAADAAALAALEG
ncbi:MAG: lysylphosphatidylglycerol synthase transmembrane domain-containing protein [Planctomycetota bacterium]